MSSEQIVQLPSLDADYRFGQPKTYAPPRTSGRCARAMAEEVGARGRYTGAGRGSKPAAPDQALYPQTAPRAGAAAQTDRTLLGTLLNELGAMSQGFVLLLDDYHLIGAPPFREGIPAKRSPH